MALPASLTYCRIFKLPPELRNYIYELSMPDTVHFFNTGIAEPSLLRTCHAIRNETHRMFYTRLWLLHITDFHPAVPTLARRKLKALRPISVNYSMHLRGRANWPNLKRWLRAVHEEGAFSPKPALRAASQRRTVVHALGELFEIVGEMEQEEWEDVLSELERYYCLLVAKDRQWGAEGF